MKNFVVLCSVLLFAARICAQTLDEIVRQLSDFEKGASKWDSSEYLDASSHALRVWNSATKEERERFADKLFLVHFQRAEILSSAGDFDGAKAELMEEVQMQKAFGGRLEYATKSPDSFFERLAKLQAGITEAIGTDPLSGMTDYLFRSHNGEYIVARQELDPEVQSITIDGIRESEALMRVLYVTAQNGKAMIERTRWVIGPKGPLEETLRRATREVLQEQDGRVSAKSLSTPVFASESKSQKPFPEQLLRRRCQRW